MISDSLLRIYIMFMFFVAKALKTAKKPLKTAKNRQIFEKRDPKIFPPAPGFFFEKLVGRFYEIGRSKKGGQKHTLPSPR